MKVKLKVLQGKSAGMEVKIPKKKFLIGRGDECHMRPKSDSISRKHCAIIVKDQRVYVRDYKSRNGTFVNDEQVETHKRLRVGDTLRVGKLEFEVIIDHSFGGEKKPKVKSVKDAIERTVKKRPDTGSTSLEFDISDWLEKEDEADRKEKYGDADTRQLRLDQVQPNEEPKEESEEDEDEEAAGNDTGEMKAADSETTEKPKKELEGAGKDEEKGDKKKKKKEFGKLPGGSVKKAKTGVDSQEAASKALKNLFGNR